MNDFIPLVTVVVPSFNEAPHIVRASLESIRSQTFTNFECIVVDESTQPDLAEVCSMVCAEDPRFVYVHPIERLGLASSLNFAVCKARGLFVARFDSDDICFPERLALQVSFLQTHPEISVVGGALDIVDDEERYLAHRRYPLTSAAISKAMQLTTAIAHPTVMFRKEVFDRLGGYNPDFYFAEDLDLWLRWMKGGAQFANLPQALVKYRQDNTCRDVRHWRFNLRARISNFNGQHLIRRTFGIACIIIWAVMPRAVQEHVFKKLLLRNGSQEMSK